MLGDVKVEMILVIPVGLGPKNRAKRTTGLLVHFLEHFALLATPPVVQNRNRIAVLEL